MCCLAPKRTDDDDDASRLVNGLKVAGAMHDFQEHCQVHGW